jgi:hypothetical protein
VKEDTAVRLLSLLLDARAGKTSKATRTYAHTRRSGATQWWIARSSVVGLTLLGAAACAATTDGNADDLATNVVVEATPKIFGGKDDNDRQAIDSVVALKVGTAGDYELCSAVLVAPNVVLTARHCVANSITTSVACDEKGRSTNGIHVKGNLDPSTINVFVGSAPKFSQASDATGKAIFAPDSEYLCDSDIALVVLDRKIENVEPVAVRLSVGVAPGETIRSIGYGENDRKVPLGTRLRKENVPVLAMGSSISDSRTALGPHEFEVGRSICQGDSGGPAISEDTNAVVGVVSRGGGCDENFGHVYTTTAGWKDLFDDAFELAGGAPIVESGTPQGPEVGPRTKPIRSPLTMQPAREQACSVGRAGAPAPAGMALVLGCALALTAAYRRGRRDDR